MSDQGAAAKSFAADIQPLFRDKDRARMDWAFDLWDHQQVKDNAALILERVEAGDMPCDGPWSAEQVATFKGWMDSGMAE